MVSMQISTKISKRIYNKFVYILILATVKAYNGNPTSTDAIIYILWSQLGHSRKYF